MQLSQEATVSAGMYRTDSERLCRRVGLDRKRNLRLVRAKEGTESVLEVKYEKGALLLQLENYNVSNENWGRKMLEQDIMLRALTALVKQVKKKLTSPAIQKRLLEGNNKELMRRY